MVTRNPQKGDTEAGDLPHSPHWRHLHNPKRHYSEIPKRRQTRHPFPSSLELNFHSRAVAKVILRMSSEPQPSSTQLDVCKYVDERGRENVAFHKFESNEKVIEVCLQH